jgi:adenylate cyclase class 2
MQEVETKILDVDAEKIKDILNSLGAKEILNTRLVVDWYGPKGLTHDGDDPWFLRIRTDGEGNSEATWKGNRNFKGTSSSHKEINLKVLDKDALGNMFLEFGMESYAHQEKDRISFVYKDWRFDLDQYPGMPAYLEIEGKSEESIQEAIKLLNLENKTATPRGERAVIKETYNLDWFNMHFS